MTLASWRNSKNADTKFDYRGIPFMKIVILSGLVAALSILPAHAGNDGAFYRITVEGALLSGFCAGEPGCEGEQRNNEWSAVCEVGERCELRDDRATRYRKAIEQQDDGTLEIDWREVNPYFYLKVVTLPGKAQPSLTFNAVTLVELQKVGPAYGSEGVRAEDPRTLKDTLRATFVVGETYKTARYTIRSEWLLGASGQ